MLQGGYFIGGTGNSSGRGGISEDVYLEDGEIIFAPVDPIYVDANGDVFFDNENKNARMYLEDGNLFVERVI